MMKAMLALALLLPAGYAQTITIVNSGSTNTAGFAIAVEKSGDAEYVQKARRRGPQTEQPQKIQKTLSESLAKRLYDDVNAALPLASLPPRHCAKSVSFGTRLTIQYGTDESPDLSCGDGGDARLKALIGDANEIVQIFRPR